MRRGIDMAEQSSDYQKGYAAGRKKTVADMALITSMPSKDERVYLACLAVVLEHCKGWTIGDKPIKDAEGYCTLARVFADNSIGKIK
jgi:hypothetical protein